VQDYQQHVDSALEAAAEDVDRLTKRRFWSEQKTQYWDWPNFQRARPWKIWFDERELADVATFPPVVVSGGKTVPDSAIFWGPWNYSPPYTFLELDRSQSYAFGDAPTPQRSVAITGLYGYWYRIRPAGAFAASANSSVTTITVTDSSSTGAGAGNVLQAGTEWMLVQDAAMTSTGQTNVSGITTESAADNVLGVTAGDGINPGEILAIDAEQMLALSVTGNNVAVERAYGGTVLADHSADSPVYAPRTLTVERGAFGSTAASHSSADPLTASLVPGMVRELAIAEAENYIFQKTSAYARTIGEAGAAPVPGGSLPDLRARVLERYGRKHRQSVIWHGCPE
jgi:hypothetical protein